MATFIVVTSTENRLLFEYNDYAPLFAQGEPEPKPSAFLSQSSRKSDFGNIDLVTVTEGDTRVRVEFKDKGGYYQVCNDGTYNLMSSLGAGVTIIESIDGVETNADNMDLYNKIVAALA